MTRALIVRRAGPGMSLQDRGRPGYLAFGLSRGGAADMLALDEGAALLGQSPELPALEMAGMGGEFEATEPTRIALTGAPMRARIDNESVTWNASHMLPAGSRLSIGAASAGNYGYLHVGGGFAEPERLGARSAHLAAGIGAVIADGAELAVGPDGGSQTGNLIDAAKRFDGGTLRVVPSLQTDFFGQSELNRFEDTRFERDIRGNRMGVKLNPEGEGFHTEAGLSVLSEIIVPGDIQITGDGAPFVLMSECQTTGGYPRIGTVLPSDLPIMAQARPGAALRFRFVSLDEAVALERKSAETRKGLRRAVRPLIRDPRDIPDLLSYQLISGVVAGTEDEGELA
ncbi:MAG: biotin-dependent carboxyltransferase family protein [Rhodobacteraceae bacterium]|nr:biotin-dependent carboxyltransferase family protein [Paracoccaceae bacterium]